jgi:hypothetical protein
VPKIAQRLKKEKAPEGAWKVREEYRVAWEFMSASAIEDPSLYRALA